MYNGFPPGEYALICLLICVLTKPLYIAFTSEEFVNLESENVMSDWDENRKDVLPLSNMLRSVYYILTKPLYTD